MARAVAAGDLSCRELAAAHIARLKEVESLRAVAVPRFEEALAEAAALDERRARGESLGPLAGVPVTIKECFHVRGLPTTLGLTARRKNIDAEDAPMVAWMRAAGAIPLAKANLPQLMLFLECDNPLYGRTDNPWNRERTPGGSSGGDAVAVATGGAALGLGTDLGGSIRLPAHFCGIFGFKPTAGSLPLAGSDTSLPGFEAINTQPGVLARHAEDVTLWWRAMRTAAAAHHYPQRPRSSGEAPVSLAGRRFACWETDEIVPASPAVRRAVGEAAAALESLGMVRAAGSPPELTADFDLYLMLCAAMGSGAWQRMLEGSEVDHRIARMSMLNGLPSWVRSIAAWIMHLRGESRLAQIVRAAGLKSAEEFCGLIEQLKQLRERVGAWLAAERVDLLLSPACATPAICHGDGLDLLPAAASTFFVNLLGLPSATLPVTRVRPAEEQGRAAGGDSTDRKAGDADTGSTGLPIGVELSAAWWEDDLLLATLEALQGELSPSREFPRTPVLPAA